MSISRRISMGWLCIASLFVAGCGGSTSTWINKDVHRANLDSCYEVRLEHRSGKRNEGFKPEQRFEEAVIVIKPRALPSGEYSLQRKNAAGWPSWSAFDFGDVEARADASRQHVWFVDRKSGKVIASVDRATGETTAPGESPPEWATPTGGELLAAQ